MSNDHDSKRPSHIAYQVREGDDNKSYFNRIGAVWQHKDGEGFNMQLDSVPVDGKVTVRSVQDRIQEAKDNARDAQEGERRNDKRSASREDRRDRDSALRYER
ncbi:hypothetical protein W911_06100 [Hyphomicrobium nitrativorans NL23]|uniref:Uncharacterized protein n=1 Tax=Hyphomicrobium nitrativorans NL23 TaxID=1029756 RepID=V5SC44_9HYPH|nr:hypothetical protein [Hyphomicrobium nitrativorans]AHB48057.1 hypothetical protein W911_06100 [Hyphomicrobium nitrativorans NL23]